MHSVESDLEINSSSADTNSHEGKLVKDLSHIAVTFGRPEKNVISIEMHHGVRKGVATLRTVRTIINNLIIGVTKGFRYKMRYVYAHFPINVNIEKNNETGLHDIEIRNFLGEKYVRRVTTQPGVDVVASPNVKDELQITGNSLENVSQSAADLQQICRVRNKDIRKVSFLVIYPGPLLTMLYSSLTVSTCRSEETLSRSKICLVDVDRKSGEFLSPVLRIKQSERIQNGMQCLTCPRMLLVFAARLADRKASEFTSNSICSSFNQGRHFQ